MEMSLLFVGNLATWTVAGDSEEHHEEGVPLPGPRIVCCREVRVAALTGIVDVVSPEESSGQNELLVAGFKVCVRESSSVA